MPVSPRRQRSSANRSQERSDRGSLLRRQNSPEVQVRLGYPAPPFGPPAGEGSSDCPVLPPLSASARRIPAEYRADHDQPDPLAERDDLEGTRARSPMFGNAGG
jgi:hypothetical protein